MTPDEEVNRDLNRFGWIMISIIFGSMFLFGCTHYGKPTEDNQIYKNTECSGKVRYSAVGKDGTYKAKCVFCGKVYKMRNGMVVK